MPAFSWAPVRRAVKYEFQLSADPAFESIVFGQRTRLVQDREHVRECATRRSPMATTSGGCARSTSATAPGGGRGSGHCRSHGRRRRHRWRPANGASVTYPRDAAGAALVTRAARVQVSGPGRDRSVARAFRSAATGTEHRDIRDGVRAARHACSGPLLLGGHAAGRRQASRRPVVVTLVQLELAEQARRGHPAGRQRPRRQPRGVRPPAHVGADCGCRSLRRRDQHRAQPEGGAKSFPAGSVVCCSDQSTGTSLSPAKVLANNSGSGVAGDPEQFGYWWRVRAVDPDGNSGEWNYGRPFDKTYPAPIAGSTCATISATSPTDLDPGTAVIDTSSPAMVWRPVPGASSYEVQVVPYVQVPNTSASVCNWSSAASDTWDVLTAATGWTPLGNPGSHRPSGILTNLPPASDGGHQPKPGASYCARVKARRDRDAKGKEVVSDWTTIAGGTAPAFRFVAPPAPSGGDAQPQRRRLPVAGQRHAARLDATVHMEAGRRRARLLHRRRPRQGVHQDRRPGVHERAHLRATAQPRTLDIP